MDRKPTITRKTPLERACEEEDQRVSKNPTIKVIDVRVGHRGDLEVVFSFAPDGVSFQKPLIAHAGDEILIHGVTFDHELHEMT